MTVFFRIIFWQPNRDLPGATAPSRRLAAYPRRRKHPTGMFPQAVEKGADRKKVQNKDRKKPNCKPPKFNQLKAKAIYKKTSEKSEVFELFALSSSVVPLYADELERAKSASFSAA